MTTTQQTVPEILESLELDRNWLIEASDLSPGTVDRNLDMSPDGLKTHITTATAIARAVGLNIDEIKWPRGLSATGRNAHSHLVDTADRTNTVATIQMDQPACRKHFTILPLNGECDRCS